MGPKHAIYCQVLPSSCKTLEVSIPNLMWILQAQADPCKFIVCGFMTMEEYEDEMAKQGATW